MTNNSTTARLKRMEDKQNEMEIRQTGMSGMVKDIHEALVGSDLHPKGLIETVNCNRQGVKRIKTQLYVIYTAAVFLVGAIIALTKIGVINF